MSPKTRKKILLFLDGTWKICFILALLLGAFYLIYKCATAPEPPKPKDFVKVEFVQYPANRQDSIYRILYTRYGKVKTSDPNAEHVWFESKKHKQIVFKTTGPLRIIRQTEITQEEFDEI